MNVNIFKFNSQFKVFVCLILFVCLVIGSTTTRTTSAFTINPYLVKCVESSTNSNKLKISSYFTGKSTSIHVKDDFNAHPNIENPLVGHDRIALVFPTFTAAAYYKSFYDFYRKHINTPPGKNVTEDLSLLSTKVYNQISQIASGNSMLFMINNLETLVPNLSLNILSDQDVNDGCIFTNNGNNIMDVIILGHQEYVTQKEYDNLKQFVANGGTLILLDSNVFYAEVNYDNATNKITFVKGHSWAFNGKSAWRSVNERWHNETSQWIGSNYLSTSSATFLNDPFEYLHHEEQAITNPKDTILLDYKMVSLPSDHQIATSKVMVAAYELNYLKGKVYSIGIYSDDVIHNLNFDKYLDDLLMQVTRAKIIGTKTISN
jgi:hypothetical protein